MESHDSYPVFHTRLVRTLRRRLTRPDGTSAGWLIATGDHFTEVPDTIATTVDTEAVNGPDEPPQLAIPQPR